MWYFDASVVRIYFNKLCDFQQPAVLCNYGVLFRRKKWRAPPSLQLEKSENGEAFDHIRAPCYPGQPRRSAEQSRLCGILSWLPYDRPFLDIGSREEETGCSEAAVEQEGIVGYLIRSMG